jgi:hypothetical protein
MRKQGIIFFTAGVLWLIVMIICTIIGDYKYERDCESYWSLSEKASTIQQKAAYINKFVASLKDKGMEGDYNAIFFKTPDNSFDKNFEALQSLKTRLDEIQKMNIASFEYQTAIQQITAQEQGEAQAMLDVFSGIWWKNNYIILWDWIAGIEIFCCIFMIIVGLIKMGGGRKNLTQKMQEAERQRLFQKL